jgi:PAS domain S-box-containing protein
VLWNGVAIEVTKRKRAEEALRRSQKRFALFMENIPALAFIQQPDGKMLFANRRLTNLLGLDPGEVAGHHLDQVYPADLAARFQEQDRLVMKNGPQAFEEELVLKEHRSHRQTHKFPIEQDNQPPLIGGISFDMTEMRRSEELRSRLETQLRQAQKMEAIGTLAGGIAHDFNNILAAIIGYSELSLVSLPEDHQAHWNLEQVLKASQRARDLVRQILSFSRQSEQDLQPVEIGPLVKEALKLLRATLPATIEIRQKIMPQEGRVMADPIQVHQMMMNLCTNAAQAMEDKGGLLEVELTEAELVPGSAPLEHPDLSPGRYQVLSVGDTGQGMDPRTLERIFEPFFTTKRRGRGTGLGLSVVHGIVMGCGGAITVESEPGEGALFRIYLPVLEGEVESRPKLPQDDLVPLGTERVLFVDDEEAIADLGRRILEYLGYQATVVTSALEALQVFEADPESFDLVITDQTMPGMTGSEMVREMLKIRPELPIILCTGYSAVINPEKARSLGVKRFLMKPLDIAQTARAIRLALAAEKDS